MADTNRVTVIRPKSGWFDLHLGELAHYKDLIFLFVKRNFVSMYKQTVLGPAWAVIQPFLTTIVFSLVFGSIAGLSANGVPSFIFYLSGNVLWGYFSGCLTQTSSTFIANSGILGKVYFPRLVMPISTVLSKLIDFAIQFAFMLIFVVIYTITRAGVVPNWYALMTPVLVLQLAMLGLGCGVIISSQSGHRMPALTAEQDAQLATTPTEELLGLDFLQPEVIRDTLHAYQLSKRGNEKRVMAEAVRWGQRGARINAIAPGIIVTPLALDEFNGPRGDFYKNMFAKCPAGRPGTGRGARRRAGHGGPETAPASGRPLPHERSRRLGSRP